VQDQPVVGVAAERLRHDLLELRLDVLDGFPGSQAGAVADPVHVRVDRERLLAERGVEHDVGGLAADAGQRLQFFAGARDLSAMMVDQGLAERDHVLRLGVEQADGLDRIAEAFFAQLDHLPGSVHAGEQRPARNIDADVRRLGGQHDGDQQLERIAGLELGRRGRIRFGKPAEKFENVVALHAPMTSRIE
jgi:hypothetical protein